MRFEWSEFETLNKRLPDNLKWKKLSPGESLLHKFGQAQNRKYVSACEHFEIVFTKENHLVDEHFSAMNMGTYNYFGPSNKKMHWDIDMLPYFAWGNTLDGWIWSDWID